MHFTACPIATSDQTSSSTYVCSDSSDNYLILAHILVYNISKQKQSFSIRHAPSLYTRSNINGICD